MPPCMPGQKMPDDTMASDGGRLNGSLLWEGNQPPAEVFLGEMVPNDPACAVACRAMRNQPPAEAFFWGGMLNDPACAVACRAMHNQPPAEVYAAADHPNGVIIVWLPPQGLRRRPISHSPACLRVCRVKNARRCRGLPRRPINWAGLWNVIGTVVGLIGFRRIFCTFVV